jgi:flagellar basal-body rod protein FlgC
MNLFGVMDVSGSAMKAERVRAEVVASNMANSETTRTADGGPYQRHHVVFEAQDGNSFGNTLLGQAGTGSVIAAGMGAVSPLKLASLSSLSSGGLRLTNLLAGGGDDAAPTDGGVAVTGVVEDASAPLQRFDPGHPDANADGYVSYPDINPLTEMVDMMGATRSYGLNVSAVQAEKGMVSSSLELLK